MKSIKFTDQELDSMIEMYTAEMEEAQLYIAHIQELLKKLGAKPEKAEVIEKEPKGGKKRGRKAVVKVVEKAEPEIRGRKAKVVVTKKEVTKAEPKKIAAITKVVVEKKPVVKPVAKKKPEPKVAATVNAVVDSLLNKKPKKEVKKAATKKSPEKKRMDEMVASAKLTKPVAKKATPKVKVPAEITPVAPIAPIEPTEQS